MNTPRYRSTRYRAYLYPGIVVALASLLLTLLYQLDVQRSQLTAQEKMLRTHTDVVRQLAEQNILLDSYLQSDIERLSEKLHIARLIVDMAPHLKDEQVVRLANVIHDQSARYQYDWKWLLAIIQAESDFDLKARSSVGACGLMQLMPDTARAIAKKIGIRFDGNRTLYNLEQNIQLGAYYFYELVQEFGDFEKAIIAYNYGRSGAIRAKKQGQDLASQYRRKILKTYARLSAISPS